MQDGTITPEEQARLMSRNAVDFSKGSPAVTDFSGTEQSHEGVSTDASSSSGKGSSGKGFGTTAANTAASLAGVTGNSFTGINTAASLVGGLIDQQTPDQLGKNVGLSALKDGMSMMGVAGQLGNAAMGLFNSDDVATTAASMVGGIAGSIAGGPFGGLIGANLGGYAVGQARESYKDGFLGDMLDSRTLEDTRQNLEDKGFSYGETAEVADGIEASREMDREKGRMEGHTLGDEAAGMFGGTMGGYGYGDPGDMMGGSDSSGASDSSSGTDGGYGDADAGGEGMI
jgi:hypothetical protein